MKQYVKDGRVIWATVKMYELIYKNQGYVPVGNEGRKKASK